LFYSNHPIGDGFTSDLLEHVFWFVLVILFCIPWDEIYTETSTSKFKLTVQKFYLNAQPVLNIAMLLLATLLLVNSTFNPFLYARF
jgi:alginate O-acetyltransferase complex protein AlgI